jgi:hypothetical protein
MIVALAHKLLIARWRLVREGTIPEAIVLHPPWNANGRPSDRVKKRRLRGVSTETRYCVVVRRIGACTRVCLSPGAGMTLREIVVER